MPYLKGKLTDVSTTQILAKGLQIEELLKKDFMQELKTAFEDGYNKVVPTKIEFILEPKEVESKVEKDKEGFVIQVRQADVLRIEQPSPDHHRDRVVVITSNRKGNLDRITQ